MKNRYRLTAIALVAALSAAPVAANDPEPGEAKFGFKLRLAGFGEGRRDLGLFELAPNADDYEKTTEGFADAQAVLHWQMSRNWAMYLRGQGFAPTGELVLTDEERPRRSEAYFAMREFWLEYSGLTTYPKELIRIGRQRLREYDGQWWDYDIEAVRWIFDTTLVQGHLGAAESFYTYRTDDSDPSATLRDRAYLFTGLSGEWHPGHRIGGRAAHAFDHTDLEEEAQAADPSDPAFDPDHDPKRVKRRYTWLGGYLHNGYYDRPEPAGLYYWAESVFLFGTREERITLEGLEPSLRVKRDVRAWSGDIGLRARFAAPFQIGVAYAFGQGGGDEGTSNRFEQTGLHSNRSRFTGARSTLYRFNEALQSDLSNLHVASAFMSIPLERFDASFAYHHITRDDRSEDIIADGIDIRTVTDSRSIGQGYDLVLATYFGAPTLLRVEDNEDTRSNLRLRGSLFQPGDAYGPDADDQYRVTLELTLWF